LAAKATEKLGAKRYRVLKICSLVLAITTGNFVWHVCKKRNPLQHPGFI
jgi:hypothetical protein